jgi:hypothetical protein
MRLLFAFIKPSQAWLENQLAAYLLGTRLTIKDRVKQKYHDFRKTRGGRKGRSHLWYRRPG